MEVGGDRGASGSAGTKWVAQGKRIIADLQASEPAECETHIAALRNARGVAFVTQVKAGFVLSGTAASGFLIGRRRDGQGWSAPSSLGGAGAGMGFQVGAQQTDVLIALGTDEAVGSLISAGRLRLGGDAHFTVPEALPGPSHGGASHRAVDRHGVHAFSKASGLFGGVSLDGMALRVRDSENTAVYGKPVGARAILDGAVPPPPELAELYHLLDALLDDAPKRTDVADKGDGRSVSTVSFAHGTDDAADGLDEEEEGATQLARDHHAGDRGAAPSSSVTMSGASSSVAVSSAPSGVATSGASSSGVATSSASSSDTDLEALWRVYELAGGDNAEETAASAAKVQAAIRGRLARQSTRSLFRELNDAVRDLSDPPAEPPTPTAMALAPSASGGGRVSTMAAHGHPSETRPNVAISRSERVHGGSYYQSAGSGAPEAASFGGQLAVRPPAAVEEELGRDRSRSSGVEEEVAKIRRRQLSHEADALKAALVSETAKREAIEAERRREGERLAAAVAQRVAAEVQRAAAEEEISFMRQRLTGMAAELEDTQEQALTAARASEHAGAQLSAEVEEARRAAGAHASQMAELQSRLEHSTSAAEGARRRQQADGMKQLASARAELEAARARQLGSDTALGEAHEEASRLREAAAAAQARCAQLESDLAARQPPTTAVATVQTDVDGTAWLELEQARSQAASARRALDEAQHAAVQASMGWDCERTEMAASLTAARDEAARHMSECQAAQQAHAHAEQRASEQARLVQQQRLQLEEQSPAGVVKALAQSGARVELSDAQSAFRLHTWGCHVASDALIQPTMVQRAASANDALLVEHAASATVAKEMLAREVATREALERELEVVTQANERARVAMEGLVAEAKEAMRRELEGARRAEDVAKQSAAEARAVAAAARTAFHDANGRAHADALARDAAVHERQRAEAEWRRTEDSAAREREASAAAQAALSEQLAAARAEGVRISEALKDREHELRRALAEHEAASVAAREAENAFAHERRRWEVDAAADRARFGAEMARQTTRWEDEASRRYADGRAAAENEGHEAIEAARASIADIRKAAAKDVTEERVASREAQTTHQLAHDKALEAAHVATAEAEARAHELYVEVDELRQVVARHAAESAKTHAHRLATADADAAATRVERAATRRLRLELDAMRRLVHAVDQAVGGALSRLETMEDDWVVLSPRSPDASATGASPGHGAHRHTASRSRRTGWAWADQQHIDSDAATAAVRAAAEAVTAAVASVGAAASTHEELWPAPSPSPPPHVIDPPSEEPPPSAQRVLSRVHELCGRFDALNRSLQAARHEGSAQREQLARMESVMATMSLLEAAVSPSRKPKGGTSNSHSVAGTSPSATATIKAASAGESPVRRPTELATPSSRVSAPRSSSAVSPPPPVQVQRQRSSIAVHNEVIRRRHGRS